MKTSFTRAELLQLWEQGADNVTAMREDRMLWAYAHDLLISVRTLSDFVSGIHDDPHMTDDGIIAVCPLYAPQMKRLHL